MATMNYAHLNQVQKFDGLARLSRTASKFVNVENLTATFTAETVSIEWITELKGLPIMNFETLEVMEAKPFALMCMVLVNMQNMTCSVSACPAKETDDKVTLALCEKYRRDVLKAMEETDLSPLTRTRKSKTESEA